MNSYDQNVTIALNTLKAFHYRDCNILLNKRCYAQLKVFFSEADCNSFSFEHAINWCESLRKPIKGRYKLAILRLNDIYEIGRVRSSHLTPYGVLTQDFSNALDKYIESLTPHNYTIAHLDSIRKRCKLFFCYATINGVHSIIDPVLFRLIYLNGLRISEACKLATSETVFDEGIITILDGKGRKDRLVYLSKDMSELCLQYLKHLEKVTGQHQRWLFPGRHICDPIGIATVEHKFMEFWEQTSFSANCGIKPTVHDLRHTFVVNRINAWSEQGLSFSQMLPYLSKYLGHKTFNETFYYYHYTREAAKNIRKKDSTIKKVIPEVMRR